MISLTEYSREEVIKSIMARSSKQVMISLDSETDGELTKTMERYKIPKSVVITIALRQYFEREKNNANTN